MKIEGRQTSKGIIHNYLFRKQIRCELCKYIMSGEKQKGHIYYRCQTKGCQTKSIREDIVERYVMNILKTISLSSREINLLRKVHSESKNDWFNTQEKITHGYELQLLQLETKEQKLIDMYLDDVIEKKQYNKQREDLFIETQEIKSRLNQLSESKDLIFESIENFLELCKTPINTYASGIQEEKRELLEIVTSNLTVSKRKVSFTMVSPYSELANRDILDECALKRDTRRTLYSKIVYMDKNTSSIAPKAMNNEQIKDFYKFLCNCSSTLSKINMLQNQYEIPTNNTNS